MLIRGSGVPCGSIWRLDESVYGNDSDPVTTLPIAHWRASDQTSQPLRIHLRNVGALAGGFASKLGLKSAGELIGLLHDLGKYSSEFQGYLSSAVGLIDYDADDYVDAKQLKGKVDHSTAGAQYIWQTLGCNSQKEQITAQVLALCVASHHSGLIDCLGADALAFGNDIFSKRMRKAQHKTHLDEVTAISDADVLKSADQLLRGNTLVASVDKCIEAIAKQNTGQNTSGPQVVLQQLGLAVRFLFSCLIDADRIDTANFERRRTKRFRPAGEYVPWPILIDRLESHLKGLAPRHPIDSLRRDISDHCERASRCPGGVYTLTVPTGGGKTLASLRFALHHAQARGLERVVYVIPFTSIIDQNAQVVREILEPESVPADRGKIVLEHHGNVTLEQQTWREKILCENWDAPIVYTTMVQFLESLFGAGTRGARRMHQMANAVLIFDEVQTLPIKCVHLFNNAVNFLVEQCNSTVVLCTATQPLLHEVAKDKGAIRLAPKHELMPDIRSLFDDLKRVEVRDNRKPGGWAPDEVALLALTEVQRAGSCLVVVNTKESAKNVFRLCAESLKPDDICHLSTDMCAAHRKLELNRVRARLEHGKTVLCVSTQLIEAGVDVDFNVVIRFNAGLDSIAQAAGRCNRNGRLELGIVHIVNPQGEHLANLPDILTGRNLTERVLDDFAKDAGRYGSNLLAPEAMRDYYQYYFFDRQSDMSYPVSANMIGHTDTLLNLLSVNRHAVQEHEQREETAPAIFFRQAFMTAAKAFKAIDAPTQGVIVPFGTQGQQLIANLYAAFDVEKEFELMRAAQQYTVNVFPHVLQKLKDTAAVHEVKPDTRILCLKQEYYSQQFGLATEPVSLMERLNV